MLLLGIIIGILTFMLLVVIHELGHFLAAKFAGVRVLEFGLGIPPKARSLGKDKQGTEYTLNWIPLGGFVRLRGEDPTDTDDFNAKDSFISAKLHHKILILIAGVVINITFAWLLLTGLFIVGTKPFFILGDNIKQDMQMNSYLFPTVAILEEGGFYTPSNESLEIGSIASGGLADQGGLIAGDIIEYINTDKVTHANLRTTLGKNIGETFTVQYTRDNQLFSQDMTCPQDYCLLGIILANDPLQDIMIQFPVHKAMYVAGQELRQQGSLTLSLLGRFFGNAITFQGEELMQDAQHFSGPVGAMKIFVDLVNGGSIYQFIIFSALISFALGIFNILPIPALDGGRLLGVLIQSICNLKKETYFIIEGYINLVFFVILMGLGIIIIFKDLIQIRGVTIPFLG